MKDFEIIDNLIGNSNIPNAHCDIGRMTGGNDTHAWYIPCLRNCIDKTTGSMEIFLSNGWVSVFDHTDNAHHFYGDYKSAVEYVRSTYREVS